MAKIATSAHLCDARRTGSMVAVASVARWRAQIAAHEQRLAMHAGAILSKLRRRERRSMCPCEPGDDFRIGMARTARLLHALRVHFRLRIFGRANAVKAMATHAGWRAVVVFLQQRPAMGAVFELRQLIGRQRGIELMHHRRIGMATCAELNDPRSIFLAIFLWPFLDEIVPKISGGIATMTARARHSASKMNVLHHFLQIHV